MIPHVTDVRLVDGTDSLQIMPHDPAVGLWLQNLDLGFPEVRDQSDPRTDADGTDDQTVHIGAKVITLDVVAPDPGSTLAINRLRAWLHPARRPYMYYTPEGQDEQRVLLRTAQHAAPIAELSKRGRRGASVQWRAPDGVAYSAVAREVTANPADEGKGRFYPLVYDRVYPFSAGKGATDVSNFGTAPTYPVVRIFGPVSGPWLTNETTGETLGFSDTLSIASGDYLEVDMGAQTARLDGSTDPADSRLGFLDFGGSTWWPLVAGINTVRFHPTTHNTPSQALFIVRDAWL